MGDRTFKWGKETFEIVTASDAETVCVVTFQPGASVPSHVHSESDESFEVLSGQLSMKADGAALTLKERESTVVKRTIPHSIANPSKAVVRFKVTYSPPADTGRFFAIGTFLSSLNPDDRNLMMKQLYVSKQMGYRDFSEMPNKPMALMSDALLGLLSVFGRLAGWGGLVDQFKAQARS